MTTRPSIVAHRGASGYLPEHTLAAYELGIRQGADAFEIDVVMTRDGVLVARHESNIAHSTDIARRPDFASLRATRAVEGLTQTGWFTEDLTWAEVQRLRAVEPLPALRSTAHDGEWGIASLEQILQLRSRLSEELGRPVGLKLEVKSPEYFTEIGLPIEPALIESLGAAHALGGESPVEVMSFDFGFLARLRGLGVENGLVFLVEEDPHRRVPGHPEWTYGRALRPPALAEVAQVVTAIGPGRRVLFPGAAEGALGEPTSVFADAHAAGLRVDCWTFRAENAFLPPEFRSSEDPTEPGDLAGVVAAYVAAGLNTVITDHPDRVRPTAAAVG